MAEWVKVLLDKHEDPSSDPHHPGKRQVQDMHLKPQYWGLGMVTGRPQEVYTHIHINTHTYIHVTVCP